MALAVIVLVALSTVLVPRQQNASAEALLSQATARADDVRDPPAGTWLVLGGSDGLQLSPGIPSAFPERRALERVTRSGQSQVQTSHVGSSEYLVRTDRRRDTTIRAVLDQGPQHRQRADLAGILLGVGAAGLLLSAFAATLLARRAVRPPSDALTLQRSFVADPWTDSELAPVELLSLCAELMASARDYAKSNRVELFLDRPEDNAVTINGNTVGLRRAVLAILDNAIAHTPASGTVTLSVSHQGQQVVIDVTDTGSGIAPAEVGRVFDRFHSGYQKAGRRNYGLGLAMAREVVTRHGGRLTIETNSDSGPPSASRFHAPDRGLRAPAAFRAAGADSVAT